VHRKLEEKIIPKFKKGFLSRKVQINDPHTSNQDKSHQSLDYYPYENKQILDIF
jgi:hypothetical protein